MTTYQGDFIGHELHVAIVVSRWNDIITKPLLDGALDTLTRHGVASSAVDVAGYRAHSSYPWLPKSLPVVGATMPSLRWAV